MCVHVCACVYVYMYVCSLKISLSPFIHLFKEIATVGVRDEGEKGAFGL